MKADPIAWWSIPAWRQEKSWITWKRRNLTPDAILITHGHGDHIAGNAPLKQRWPGCRLVVGSGDEAKLTDPALNLSAAFGVPMVSPPADVVVHDGDVFSAAGFDLEVRAIPGHSQGHVIYLWREHQPMLAFVGDVIFSGSVGRTDFPDGDFDQLAAGIRAKLFTLPDDTMLLPGHGPVHHRRQGETEQPVRGSSVEAAPGTAQQFGHCRHCRHESHKMVFRWPRKVGGLYGSTKLLGRDSRRTLRPRRKIGGQPSGWYWQIWKSRPKRACLVGSAYISCLTNLLGPFLLDLGLRKECTTVAGTATSFGMPCARAYAESVKQITDSAEAPGNSR